MADDSIDADELVRRIATGDQQALAEAFALYRGRLRRMVLLRLDRRLQSRIDASDILHETYLDVAQRAAEYAAASVAATVARWVSPGTGARGSMAVDRWR